MAVNITNPGNLHASTLTIGSITNTGGISGSGASVTMPVTGAGLGGSGRLTGGAGTVWASTSTGYNSPSVNIHQDGIDLAERADIKIGGQSIKETLQAIQDRLAILVPDPVKLEKYAALKAAYEHYKLLEKLCNEDD